jgi:hypothetical protein
LAAPPRRRLIDGAVGKEAIDQELRRSVALQINAHRPADQLAAPAED